jgi:hypothetical protein
MVQSLRQTLVVRLPDFVQRSVLQVRRRHILRPSLL